MVKSPGCDGPHHSHKIKPLNIAALSFQSPVWTIQTEVCFLAPNRSSLETLIEICTTLKTFGMAIGVL